MKRTTRLFLALLGIVVLLFSCKKEQRIEIVKVVHESNYDDLEQMIGEGIIEYDSNHVKV